MKKKKVRKIKIKRKPRDDSNPLLWETRPNKKYPSRTKAGQRLLMAQIAVCIAESKTLEETCDELDIRHQEYTKYKDVLYKRQETQISGKTELEIYTDYVLKQTKLIRDLEMLKKRFGLSKQYNALVGAVKTQSDILDRIITRGQDLGIINKTPDSINIIAGIDVRSMSDVQIRHRIEEEIGRAQTLLVESTGRKSKKIKILTPGKEEVDLEDLEMEGEA